MARPAARAGALAELCVRASAIGRHAQFDAGHQSVSPGPGLEYGPSFRDRARSGLARTWVHSVSWFSPFSPPPRRRTTNPHCNVQPVPGPETISS